MRKNESSVAQSSTADEAVDLLFSLEDGAQLPASLLEEVGGDDGDGKELDYMAEDGSSSLVMPELLHSLPELFTDEPALRDSLLNQLDEESARLEFTEEGPTVSMETGEQLIYY